VTYSTAMLVFIDESGYPGFKFTRGSDPVFAIGMVIFADGAAATSTIHTIGELRKQLGHKSEFKFSRSSASVRDAFFHRVSSCPFTVRALIVRKDALCSPVLQRNADSFYNFCAKALMMEDAGTLHSARVRIDGLGSRNFQRNLGSDLRRELGERVRDVKMSDSARDPLLQLADMCIGAIARAERDREEAERWKRLLAPRIAQISYLNGK
jgi:hypothetical protein